MSDESSSLESGPRLRWWLVLLPVVCFVLILVARIGGLSDMHMKDQPRTISYTVDMLVNGRWFWPRDMQGVAAVKPPMYNWLAVVPLAVTGMFTEWVFKLPSIAGTVVLCLAMLWLIRRRAKGWPCDWRVFGAVAVTIWLANFAVYRLTYIARPDMVLSVFMACGWMLGAELLRSTTTETDKPISRGKRFGMQLGLWLCVAGAFMTKGTPAVFVVLYVVFDALLIRRSLPSVMRTGIVWGLPLAVVVCALLLWPAWGILHDEVLPMLSHMEGTRMAQGGGWHHFTTLYQMPHYFVVRFVPWSIFFIIALVFIKPTQWLKHTLAPEILWVLLLMVCFSVPSLKRDDYLLPCYPAAAVVVAWMILLMVHDGKRWMMPATVIAALAVLIFAMVNDWYLDHRMLIKQGDFVLSFADKINEQTGHSRQIVFDYAGYSPLQSVLGINQASRTPSAEQLAEAQWVVMPLARTGGLAQPLITAEHMPERHHDLELGFYQLTDPLRQQIRAHADEPNPE